MSLFPGYAAQNEKASTSRQFKKEDPSDSDDERPVFNSFSIAKAAKEKERRKEQQAMEARIAEKKDKAAVKRFNMGDTSDEDELTMTVDRSESEDENTRRIYNAQRNQRMKEDQLHERKRKNRERLEEKLKQFTGGDRTKVKEERCSSSDSDSSYRRDRKRKKYHRRSSSSESDYKKSDIKRSFPKKKKEEKRERDRYIEPEKPKYNNKSKNWHYMATVGVTLQNPDSYMMDERNPDPLLKAMDKTESSQSANYDHRFTAVLGAPYKVNKLFFPAKTINRTARVLDKPITLRNDPESSFVSFSFNPGESIQLSTVRCDKQIELTEDPTPERLAARLAKAAANEKMAMESDPVMKKMNREKKLAELKKERMETNSKLKENGKDENAWLRFVSLEEEINKLENRDAVGSNVSSNERKEAILQNALKNLPKSSALHVKMMELKRKMDVPVEQLNEDWKNLMNRLPNSLALWRHRIMGMRHDSKQFNRIHWIGVVDEAMRDLRGLVEGTMRSHLPEPGTHLFMIELMVLRVRMELAMGFIERAASTVQVLLESNIFVPPYDIIQQFLPLETVWKKNLPLVGEPNGRGRFHYRLDTSIQPSREWMDEMKEASEKYKEELVELGREAETMDQMVIFARHERLHEKYYWRPVRAEVAESEEEEERQVEMNDLPYAFYPPDCHLSLAVRLVRELGGLFYGKMLDNMHWEDPVGVRLFSFGLLNPYLHSVPVGLPQFIDRILSQMAMNNPSRGWMQFNTMSVARIRTRAWFIAQRETPFDMTAVLKELADIAKDAVISFINTNGKDENCEMAALGTIMYIYEALNLFEVHSEGMNPKAIDKSVKAIVKSIKTKALIWSGGKPLKQLSNVNKSIILILATLLVRLPGSWDERRHRVQCVILGKDGEWKDFQTRDIPLNEQIEAQSMVEEMMEQSQSIPSDQSNSIHVWLSLFFGYDSMLSSVLDVLFLFANAAKSGSPCPPKVRDIILKIYTNVSRDEKLLSRLLSNGGHEQVLQASIGATIIQAQKALRISTDHYEQFFVYYIRIIKHGQNEFRQVLNNGIENHNCPNSIFLAREYINSQQKMISEVRMLADLKRKADEKKSVFNSLSRLYAHRKQFTRVVASAEMQSDLSIATRVVKVYIDEAKRHQDPLLWRYALNLAAEFKQRKLGDEVFTQAFADCSWSRDLHLDYIQAFPDHDGNNQLLPMIEKHIRMRGEPDHVQTYIDHAKRVDGRE